MHLETPAILVLAYLQPDFDESNPGVHDVLCGTPSRGSAI